MSNEFEWWQNALNGVRGPIHADEPMSGFYRQRNKAKVYEPVAYWKDTATGEQRCHINGRAVDLDRMMHTWPYASKNPITSEAYWHRMDKGAWADIDQAANDSAKGPEIDPATDPVGSLEAEIAKALAGIADYSSIDSDEQSAKAQTLRSALTGLKGKAEKAYEERNRPLLEAQKTLRETWFPLRDNAADGANTLRKSMGAWEDIKRENQKRAAEQAIKAEREHAEAMRKAAEADEPPPPPPPPPANISATPAPLHQIRGGSGRAASVQLKKTVTAIDIDKAFAQFRDEPELYAFLLDLSQKVVSAGFVAIGATIEEKADIR